MLQSVRISELPSADTLTEDDLIVVDQPDDTKKATLFQVLNHLGDSIEQSTLAVLAQPTGAGLVGTTSGLNVQQEIDSNLINIREHWKHTLTDVGLNLVDGSFEEGAAVEELTDVVWHRATGKFYTWGGTFPKEIPEDSTPETTGGVGAGAWVDRSDVTVRGELLPKIKAASIGGLGDYSVDNQLFIFCGDSTTEQMGGNAYGFDKITANHRVTGGAFENVIGTVNFGGSGFKLSLFVNEAEKSLPVVSTSNLGVGKWDYYGHKPTGAVNLNTALAWRAGKADKVTWVICYGINDCILDASIGNLTEGGITDYIYSLLNSAVERINSAYPTDSVILRSPNPMTARPYVPAAGYPSPTAYPTFGNDIGTDQAIVEKWNNAINSAYKKAASIHPRTVLFDTWEYVFGKSNTTLDAASELPWLRDLVHPSASGYTSLCDALINFLTGYNRNKYFQRVIESTARSSLLSINPWEVDANYLHGNPQFKLLCVGRQKATIESSYIDTEVLNTDFYAQIDQLKPIYIASGHAVAQKFSTYSVTSIGDGIRLFNVSPSAEMQDTDAIIYIFQESSAAPSHDLYLITQINSVKPRDIYLGSISGGGSGYIDVVFNSNINRISSKWGYGLKGGTLYVGGSIGGSISLSTSTPAMLGTPSQRVVRFLISGDYTSYVNQPCCIMVADSSIDPRIYEAGGVTQGSVIRHISGAVGYVYCPYPMPSGATMTAIVSKQVPSNITVEVYKTVYPNRTLLGTITIAPNTGSATLTSGNPTSVLIGDVFEYVLTSATVADAFIGLRVVPV